MEDKISLLMDQLKLTDDPKIQKYLIDPGEKIKGSITLKKINQRNEYQTRNMLITTSAVYNLKGKNPKRRILIKQLLGVTMSTVNDGFVIHIDNDYDYRYESPAKKSIYSLLKEEFARLTKLVLPLYMVTKIDLKEYTFMTNGLKKGFKRQHPPTRPNQLAFKTPDDDERRKSTIYARDRQNVCEGDFQKVKLLGRGSFGKVYLVRNKTTNNKYAMKSLRKDLIIDYGQLENIKNQRKVLDKTNHQFIVQLDYVFESEQKIFFVMQFISGGELFGHLSKKKRFDQERAKFYAAQIVSALKYLHDNGIMYRDIKPENVLIDQQGYIRIADFGLSKFLSSGQLTTTFCGTPEYLAPQIIKGEGHDQRVDWWSLGILLYEMLVGIPPFYHKNRNLMFEIICKLEVRFPDPERHKILMSDEVKDLIRGLLNKDKTERLDYLGIKKHPFFSSIDWSKLEKKELELDPEWVPQIKGSSDVSYFDSQFTESSLKDSLVPEEKMPIVKHHQAKFKEIVGKQEAGKQEAKTED